MLQLRYREINGFNLSLLHQLKMSQFHNILSRDLKKLMPVFTWTIGDQNKIK